MCFRLVSTFERCGHQDNITHIQLCDNARACTPSSRCYLAPNDMISSPYTIGGYCGPCSLNHAVVRHDGRLHEASANKAIVFHVDNSNKVKGRVDITLTKNNDTRLVWKNPGSGISDGGRGDATGGASNGGTDDWAAAKDGGFGDRNAAPGADVGDWSSVPNASSAAQFQNGGITESDAAAGADVGGWSDEDDQRVGEQGSFVEQDATWTQTVPSSVNW